MMLLRHPVMLLAAVLLIPCAPLNAQQEKDIQEEPTTHREAALMLINLLRQTDDCLATCVDASTVRAALPKLRELATLARDFKRMQNALPEPTTQDYMAAQDLTGDFNTVWNSIRAHIERMESAKLLTPELREILAIAPPAPSRSSNLQ